MQSKTLKHQFNEAIQGKHLTSDGVLDLDGCRSFSTPSTRIVGPSESVRDILRRVVRPHGEECSPSSPLVLI